MEKTGPRPCFSIAASGFPGAGFLDTFFILPYNVLYFDVRYSAFLPIGTCSEMKGEKSLENQELRKDQAVNNDQENPAGQNGATGTAGSAVSGYSEKTLTIDKDSTINLLVNQSGEDDLTIDLVQVFYNMKEKAGIYVWTILLCMVAGVSLALVYYQLTKAPETVYSAVTLTYEVDNEDEEDPEAPDRIMVQDLTAPDSKGELDLNQITSSTVLQEALEGIELSTYVSLNNLQRNISIQRILSDESRRDQEILSSMLENKNEGAYLQMQEMEYSYRNTFVVSLSNGFGEEGSRTKTYLRGGELALLLERILDAWNHYLVTTYAELKLPDDAVSAISIEELDIPESVDQIREAINTMYSYSEGQSDEVKAYRSYQTGYTLTDLMERMQLLLNTEVENLSAYVFSNGIAADRARVIDNYRYRLLMAQTELKEINENTAAIRKLLDNYKNDQILVASTSAEGDETAQTVQTNTAYYNELLVQQVENEQLAAQKRQEVIEYESRISALNNAENVVTQAEIDAVEDELSALLSKSEDLVRQLRSHMSEIFSTDFYNTLADHSVAISDSKGFLSAASKKMIIGLALGLLIGLGLWFIGGLLPELTKGRDDTGRKAEASEKAEAVRKEAEA
jgi:hypothetical protein